MAGRVFAVAAHPDDIEFLMAGTLLHLRDAGWELHCMNVANGSCGTARLDRDAIVEIRTAEAREAVASIGAVFHPPLVDDLRIFYNAELLDRMGAVLREVAPDVLLVQSPADYMEDHQNTVRLAVTAAFCRGMRNFPTAPSTAPVETPVAVYHAQPHGNRDPLRGRVTPELYVDIGPVLDRKRAMLACHRSQKEWLDVSQGMDSYLHQMEAFGREVGALSGRYAHAEGWRRRLHLGFGAADADPLADALGDRAFVSEAYRASLDE